MSVTITQCLRRLNDEAQLQPNLISEKHEYMVTVAEATATPLEVAVATYTTTDPQQANMPVFYGVHPIYPLLVVTNKTAKRNSDSGKPHTHIWTVTVEYTIPKSGEGPTGDGTDAKNIRVKVSGVEQTVYTQLSQDTSSTTIRNAAGDLYPDPIEITLYDKMITVDFERTSIPTGTGAARGTINDAIVTFTIPQGGLTFSETYAKHTLLLKSIDYEVTLSRSDPSAHVFHFTVQLLYRADTWDQKLPEKGYRWKVSGALTDWKEHAEYLDATGAKLGAGSPIVSTAAIQKYKEYDLTTFLGTLIV